MTITGDKIHKYLGINIDYSSSVKLLFYAVNYIGNVINDIPEYIKGESETPAKHQLFDIVEDATKPSWTDADLFRQFLTHILYLENRSHTDLQNMH